MRISPVGIMTVTLGALIGIFLWVVAIIGLPNEVTHKNLSENPKVLSSAVTTSNPSSSMGGTGSTGAATTPWYTLDKAPKTLDLAITSATTSDNSGLNFDGGYKGSIIVTVPVGWTVNVTFTSKDSMMPHSVGFTTWASKTSATGTFVPAFKGSIGADFTSGITSASPPIKFSFKATTAGQYAFVCGVPGHAAGGMWDEFDVSGKATSPTVKINNQTFDVH